MAYNYRQDEDDYEYGQSEDSDLAEQSYNDAQIQTAIRYMLAEGGNNPLDQYLTRVNAIEEHILQNFIEYNKPFDPQLYRRLQAMVREVQHDVLDIDDDISSLSTDSDDSVEALYRKHEDDFDDSSSVEELYRSDLLDSDPGPSAFPGTSGWKPPSLPKFPAGFPMTGADSDDDDALEKRFLYGGPRNDVEEWYKGLMPMLPFGENPYMERWDSMKINFDLNKSSQKTDDTKPVRTDVPYEDVEPQNFKNSYLPSAFDSGSRFKLPVIPQDYWSMHKFHPARLQNLWEDIVVSFNAGGPLQVEKNYTPRIFLPKIGNIKVGVNIRLEGNQPPTILKKFANQRNAAAERDYTRATRTPPTSKTVPPLKPPTRAYTPAPAAEPSEPVKRGRGRPRKAKNADPTYHPPRRVSVDDDAPTTPRREELEDLYEAPPAPPRKPRPRKIDADPSYKPATSPMTPNKKKRDLNLDDERPAKKVKTTRKRQSVGFAGEAPEPSTKAKPSKKALPKKSAIKATTGRYTTIPAEDRDILNTAKAVTGPKKRGQTRSGAVQFKPARLRSLSGTR